MQYVINRVKTTTKSIAVEADSPEEAKGKEGEGNVISLDENERVSVNVRPQATVSRGNMGQGVTQGGILNG